MVLNSISLPFQLALSDDFFEVLPDQRAVRGVRPGSGVLSVIGLPDLLDSTTLVTVLDNEVAIMKLDPIVAALRMSFTSEPSEDRLGTTEVSVQVLSVLSYSQERVEVTASVVLGDGRRVVIADPSLLQIKSSNESIVRVENNFIVANETGNVYLNVSFIVCGRQLATSIIDVTVQFDQHRPMFPADVLEASIIENSVVGSVVASVLAMDDDIVVGEQADTEYRIKDDPFDGLWVIDTLTGEITLSGPIDREDRDRYELVVEATDRLQRQAEVSSRPNSGTMCVGGSGGGSGGGTVGSGDCNGELVPDPDQIQDPETVVIATPPDSINVSFD